MMFQEGGGEFFDQPRNMCMGVSPAESLQCRQRAQNVADCAEPDDQDAAWRSVHERRSIRHSGFSSQCFDTLGRSG